MSSESPQPSYPTPPPTPPGKNTVGLIALVTAIIGFVFACIPGALIVGWVLLPIAFILAIVGLVLKDKPRKSALAALIISIVGVIVGVVVFVTVVATAVDDAFNHDVTVQPPAATATEGTVATDADESESPTAREAALGTRANPFPIGSELSSRDWIVVVNSVALDATEAVLAEEPYYEPPLDGNVYMLVNVTATYIGDDPAGAMPWPTIEFVSAGGNSFDAYTFDTFAMPPQPFDVTQTLYEGASTSGNILLQVPADAVVDGVLAVTVDLFSDTAFVAVQ